MRPCRTLSTKGTLKLEGMGTKNRTSLLDLGLRSARKGFSDRVSSLRVPFRFHVLDVTFS